MLRADEDAAVGAPPSVDLAEQAATELHDAADAAHARQITSPASGAYAGRATRRPSVRALDVAARWIEISPGLVGYPAAAERLDAPAQRWRLPDDVWDHLAPGRYMLRVIDAAGREREAIAFRR